MKRCKRCGQEKPHDQFWLDKRGIYSARCKECHGLAQRTCAVCAGRFEAKSKTKLCSPACRLRYRPQTFRACDQCGRTFGPLANLRRRFCSQICKNDAQATGAKVRYVSTDDAKQAHLQVRYAIWRGDLVRPDCCEECGQAARIEAAHFNYSEPLRVRWLCKPCHRRWDFEHPKGGAVAAPVC